MNLQNQIHAAAEHAKQLAPVDRNFEQAYAEKVGVAGRADPVDLPNIQSLLSAHRGTIEYLAHRVGELEKLLAPVLAPAPPANDSNSTLTARSGMGSVISQSTAELQNICDTVSRLMSRLDL